jgi:hypothetical protein
MSLSINPIQNLASNISSELGNLANAANQSAGNFSMPTISSAKQKLDATVNRLSGGFGSSLNGITGKLNSSSVSNLSGTVQNFAQNGLTSLSDDLGSFSTAGQDVIDNIASGGSVAGLSTGLLNGPFTSADLDYIEVDLVSGARAKNIPSTATLELDEEASVVKVYPSDEGDWRIRINSMFGQIVFPTTPTFSLSNKANYNNQELVHANFPHPVYKNSTSDDISISGEFPVETEEDAENWLRTIALGRGLTKMFFGNSSPQGNPPPICTLSGYGRVLEYIPVVIKSFQVDFKDDVHYILVAGSKRANTGTPVPRLSTIQIVCQPVYSKSSQRRFDLGAYVGGGGNIPF